MNTIMVLVLTSACLSFRPILGGNTLRMDDWNKTADYMNENKGTLYLPGNTTPPDQPHVNWGWHVGGETLIMADEWGYAFSLRYVKAFGSSWDYSTDDSLGHIDRERSFNASTFVLDNSMYLGNPPLNFLVGVGIYWPGMDFNYHSIRDNGYEYTVKTSFSGFGWGWHLGAQLSFPNLPLALSLQYRHARVGGLMGNYLKDDNGSVTEWDNARLGLHETEGQYYFFNWDEYWEMPDGFRDGTLDFSGLYFGIILSLGDLGTSACLGFE